MKVLVTGANGFLGCHVVEALVNAGYDVRAFILDGTSEKSLQGLRYETCSGNLLNPFDVEKALVSCDYLVHTAAVTDVWPTKNPSAWKINVEVVQRLVEAMKNHPIKKCVYVGTANSFGFGTLEHPGTEEDAFNSGRYGLDYILSKKAAQTYLLEQAIKNPLPVVIVNPTFMIGDKDMKPGSGELILSVIRGQLPGCASGGRCFAPVKDVAQGCVEALKKGRVGECYILGGRNLSYRDFFNMIGDIAGIKAPKRILPKPWILFAGALLEMVSKIFKKKPKLTLAIAKICSDTHYYSSEKAIRELGYTQSEIKTALQEAIHWYREQGYLKDKTGNDRRRCQ